VASQLKPEIRHAKSLAVCLLAAGLAGCTGAVAGSSAVPTPGVGGQQQSAAAQAIPGTKSMRAAAQSAALKYDNLYFSGRFMASWRQLAPPVRRQIPQRVWVRVHSGCRPAIGAQAKAINGITVFGRVAIVTVAISEPSAQLGRSRQVFSYTRGQWNYSPQYPSVYHHGSVAADIAAARKAGLCGSWKDF